MRWITIDNATKDQPLPTGDFRAVAIAASSLVDVCKVGQLTLGVGAVMPVLGGETISAVRGFRTGTIGSVAVDKLSTLVLACYEPGDPIVPLGPRAPAYVARKMTSSVASQLAFRIPFSGRREANIWWRAATPASAADQLMLIRRIHYLSPEECRADPTAQPYVEQDLATYSFFGGTGAYPSSTVTGGGEIAFTNATIYIGNALDQQANADLGFPGAGRNGADELEVWISGAAGTVMFVSAEARGERGA